MPPVPAQGHVTAGIPRSRSHEGASVATTINGVQEQPGRAARPINASPSAHTSLLRAGLGFLLQAGPHVPRHSLQPASLCNLISSAEPSWRPLPNFTVGLAEERRSSRSARGSRGERLGAAPGALSVPRRPPHGFCSPHTQLPAPGSVQHSARCCAALSRDRNANPPLPERLSSKKGSWEERGAADKPGAAKDKITPGARLRASRQERGSRPRAHLSTQR